jgi:hypothetical protein
MKTSNRWFTLNIIGTLNLAISAKKYWPKGEKFQNTQPSAKFMARVKKMIKMFHGAMVADLVLMSMAKEKKPVRFETRMTGPSDEITEDNMTKFLDLCGLIDFL